MRFSCEVLGGNIKTVNMDVDNRKTLSFDISTVTLPPISALYILMLFWLESKKMKWKICVFAGLLNISSVGHAGTQTGTIEALYVRASDGLVYFVLKGSAKTSSPACATMHYWMLRDENSASGKRQYAQLLAAQLTGKTIVVSGMNSCVRWADGEDVDVITITP